MPINWKQIGNFSISSVQKRPRPAYWKQIGYFSVPLIETPPIRSVVNKKAIFYMCIIFYLHHITGHATHTHSLKKLCVYTFT